MTKVVDSVRNAATPAITTAPMMVQRRVSSTLTEARIASAGSNPSMSVSASRS